MVVPRPSPFWPPSWNRAKWLSQSFALYRRHLAAVGHGLGRWRSNPSNPLGVLAENNETAAVWDEAFYPLATGKWTRGDSESWRVGSLTKLWACAGLRLGYVIAPSDEGGGRDPEGAAPLVCQRARSSRPSVTSSTGPTFLAGRARSRGWEASSQAS